MFMKVFKRMVLMALLAGGGFLLLQKLPQMGAAYTDQFADLPLGVCVSYAMKKKELTDLSQLKKLSCQKKGITSLEGLEQLTGLEELYLQGNDLTSLESMGYIPALRKISVASNKQMTTLKGLERAENLEELQANLSSELSDISAIAQLTELRIVAAMQDNISDISALAQLSKLEEVILNYNHISDISALAGKPELKRLQIYSNPVSSVEPLLGNASMQLVGIGGKEQQKRHLCEDMSRLKSRLSAEAVIYGPEVCES